MYLWFAHTHYPPFISLHTTFQVKLGKILEILKYIVPLSNHFITLCLEYCSIINIIYYYMLFIIILIINIIYYILHIIIITFYILSYFPYYILYYIIYVSANIVSLSNNYLNFVFSQRTMSTIYGIR